MKTLSILITAALVSTSALVLGAGNRAFAASDGNKVVAICGPNGAVRIVSADKVPVGCHVATVNSPPAGHR